jgi:hypothetical protein
VGFSIHNDSDISAVFEELHNLFAFSGQLCPTRFGVGILFQSAQVSVFKAEIDLLKFAFGGLADGIAFAVKIDGFLFIDQRLLPDSQKDRFKTRGHETRIANSIETNVEGSYPRIGSPRAEN